MCSRYRNRASPDQWREEFSQTRIPLTWAQIPNLRPGDIAITDMAPIVRYGQQGAELVQRRWSWNGPSGKPVYNYRSEGREFTSGDVLSLLTAFMSTLLPPTRSRRQKTSGCSRK